MRGCSRRSAAACCPDSFAPGEPRGAARDHGGFAMKIGYFAIGLGPLTNPDWVRTVASSAERLGFSTIWAPEHVVLLDRFASKYPYSSGDFPVPTDTPISDPFTTLAFAAAWTKRIRPGTGFCLVPEHNP